MKILNFKRGQEDHEWALFLFGQPLIRKLIRYKMQCNDVRGCCEIPDDMLTDSAAGCNRIIFK